MSRHGVVMMALVLAASCGCALPEAATRATYATEAELLLAPGSAGYGVDDGLTDVCDGLADVDDGAADADDGAADVDDGAADVGDDLADPDYSLLRAFGGKGDEGEDGCGCGDETDLEDGGDDAGERGPGPGDHRGSGGGPAIDDDEVGC
jgi:hypothetical protein